MKAFTKLITQQHMSQNDIQRDALAHAAFRRDNPTVERVLLETIQELASAIIKIKKELE